MKVSGTEGIDATDTHVEEAKTFLLVTAGESYDLTTIDVKCRSGYTFDEWYYCDSNGQEVKIIDSEHFTTYDNMTIYAKAKFCPQDYGACFTGIIAVLVIVAILGFAYMALRDYGIIQTN